MNQPPNHKPCFHCGLDVPAGSDWSVIVEGTRQSMCCPGCQAVAQAIVDNKLEAYYRQRTANAPSGRGLIPDALQALDLYDLTEVQQSFVKPIGPTLEASLILEGIQCAACIWLNENHLRRLPGVISANINYATHRARVRWDPQQIKLSDILAAIRYIGYQAHPYDPDKQQVLLEQERKTYLKRLGLAGVLGMQVMILAVAMYLGDWSGMEQGFRTFFTWLSLLLTLPILFYSAQPFFTGAFRDLSRFHAGMDVPVSLGVLLAFAGSAWSTWAGSGHVYFDSVAMFVFFLLTARYFEMVARKKSAETTEALIQARPAMARRYNQETGSEEWISQASINVGDQLRVRPGESLAADGRITEGRSSVDESLLTGEHEPVAKTTGDEVLAGSINIDSPVVFEVTATGDMTVLSSIQQMMEQAQTAKPPIARLADRAASWFVSIVLLLAISVATWWLLNDPSRWLAVTVSVLVVTCPCALSLATPTALTAAIGSLTRLGAIPATPNAIERLARATTMVFDKTGTLTVGRPVLIDTWTAVGIEAERAVAIAQALERHSQHPVANALRGIDAALPLRAENIEQTTAAGIRGEIGDETYFIGHLNYVSQHCPLCRSAADAIPELDRRGSLVYLADNTQLIAMFELDDTLRPDAKTAINALEKQQLRMLLLSGDHQRSVKRVADLLGIDEYSAEQTPGDKLDRIRSLQQDGAAVAMIGDGINDAPVLAAADVSLAMGSGAQLAASKADFVLINDRLIVLAAAKRLAVRTLRIVRQNIAWAVLYNIVALPLAAIGWIAPWVAALGMSASSLLVVANALRLTRTQSSND
jgi:Cu2+-exporting ATPase